MAHWALLLASALAASAHALEPPACPPTNCLYLGGGQNEYTYTVDGNHVEIEFTDSGYFSLKCSGNLTLNSLALPRFHTQLRVYQAVLARCPPPHGSYVAALQRLNVRALDRLDLRLSGTLAPDQLAGLRLRALVLELAPPHARLQLRPGALQALPALRRLLLDGVTLPPDELLRLPTSLQVLQLLRVNASVPAAALERLPELANLTVRQHERVRVQLAGDLKKLTLETPAAPHVLLPTLRTLTLNWWAERAPEPWQRCDALDALHVWQAAAEELPAHWLRDCAALRELRLEDVWRLRRVQPSALQGAAQLAELHIAGCALTELPAALLAGAARLRRLHVSNCALQALPPRLLDDATQLTHLDLSANRLIALPGGLFSLTKSLNTLNLSKNNLTTNVFSSLTAITTLTSLVLSDNINIKDSCGQNSDPMPGPSPLQYLNGLITLNLHNTSTSIICRDWREQMPSLKDLVLSDCNITIIRYADLQFNSDVTVNLHGNNVTGLHYKRENYYQNVLNGSGESRALLKLQSALACDCSEYWAARALRDRPRHVRLRGALCADGRALQDVPLQELQCAAPALCAAAPRACACAVQPRAAAPPATGYTLRLRCERAGLARLADALAPVRAALLRQPDHLRQPRAWDLRLAHNRIARLDVAELPPGLTTLDLRDNEISVVDADAARALVAGDERRVWLAQNPLACDCGAADTLLALRALADYDNATCAGGGALAGAAPCLAALAWPAPAAALGALALLAVAALAALLALPALRLHLKAALHARGWLPAPAEEDDGRRFDAFVSFSHGDERFVREELVARLEAGPAPLRLCLHYRDWAPGGWIPAQIAASVRASRRTVAVVSAHFLRSAWARAEWRAAHAQALRDARPRLVVLLLDAPERLPLDAALRRYLATNTYVRWGDPWFWQKLRLALPRGRPLAPPPAAAPAATLSSPVKDPSSPPLPPPAPSSPVTDDSTTTAPSPVKDPSSPPLPPTAPSPPVIDNSTTTAPSPVKDPSSPPAPSSPVIDDSATTAPSPVKNPSSPPLPPPAPSSPVTDDSTTTAPSPVKDPSSPSLPPTAPSPPVIDNSTTTAPSPVKDPSSPPLPPTAPSPPVIDNSTTTAPSPVKDPSSPPLPPTAPSSPVKDPSSLPFPPTAPSSPMIDYSSPPTTLSSPFIDPSCPAAAPSSPPTAPSSPLTTVSSSLIDPSCLQTAPSSLPSVPATPAACVKVSPAAVC